MNFKVGEKEYTLEYTFEAAERHECIDAAMDIFGGVMMTKIDGSKSEELQIRDFLRLFQIFREWQGYVLCRSVRASWRRWGWNDFKSYRCKTFV